MTFFDSTADLVGQLNGNGQKVKLQIDAVAPPDGGGSFPLWVYGKIGRQLIC